MSAARRMGHKGSGVCALSLFREPWMDVAGSKMMRAERQQQDDGDRNADQPKQDGTHTFRLVLARSGSNNGRAAVRFPPVSVSKGGSAGLSAMLATAAHSGNEHDRGGVKDHDQHQPA